MESRDDVAASWLEAPLGHYRDRVRQRRQERFTGGQGHDVGEWDLEHAENRGRLSGSAQANSPATATSPSTAEPQDGEIRNHCLHRCCQHRQNRQNHRKGHSLSLRWLLSSILSLCCSIFMLVVIALIPIGIATAALSLLAASSCPQQHQQQQHQLQYQEPFSAPSSLTTLLPRLTHYHNVDADKLVSLQHAARSLMQERAEAQRLAETTRNATLLADISRILPTPAELEHLSAGFGNLAMDVMAVAPVASSNGHCHGHGTERLVNCRGSHVGAEAADIYAQRESLWAANECYRNLLAQSSSPSTYGSLLGRILVRGAARHWGSWWYMVRTVSSVRLTAKHRADALGIKREEFRSRLDVRLERIVAGLEALCSRAMSAGLSDVKSHAAFRLKYSRCQAGEGERTAIMRGADGIARGEERGGRGGNESGRELWGQSGSCCCVSQSSSHESLLMEEAVDTTLGASAGLQRMCRDDTIVHLMGFVRDRRADQHQSKSIHPNWALEHLTELLHQWTEVRRQAEFLEAGGLRDQCGPGTWCWYIGDKLGLRGDKAV